MTCYMKLSLQLCFTDPYGTYYHLVIVFILYSNNDGFSCCRNIQNMAETKNDLDTCGYCYSSHEVNLCSWLDL